MKMIHREKGERGDEKWWGGFFFDAISDSVRNAIEFFIRQSRWRNESWTCTSLYIPPPSPVFLPGSKVITSWEREGWKGWVTTYKGYSRAQSNGCENHGRVPEFPASKTQRHRERERDYFSLLKAARLLIRLCSTSLSHSHLTELPHSKR